MTLQSRVQAQNDRIAELCALRRSLTDEEVSEMIRLKKGERARARMRQRHAETRV